MTAGTAVPEAPALEVVDLHKSFGALHASDGVSLTVETGALHAVIGPNGAGKTTLVGQLAGEIRPDAGRIRLFGRDVTHLPAHARPHLGLARSFQITSICPEFTAEDNVALAVQSRAGHSFRFWRGARDDRSLRDPARAQLARVGLAERADRRAADLAHGEQRQLELAMALALQPRLLLLDEPMAGMGREETGRMIDVLKGLKGTITMLLVEHDMDAVFSLADRISVLVYGRVIASGPPAAIRSDPAVREAYLGEGH